MIRINLLPYRAARRQHQVYEHVIVVFIVVAVAMGVCVGMHMVTHAQLDSINAQYVNLQSQNQTLSKMIGETGNLKTLRTEVQRKLDLVDTLQKGRFRSLELLLVISRVIPNNVWLESVIDKGGEIKLEGYAETSKSIAMFMSALDKSESISNVKLGRISINESKEELAVESFDLKVIYRSFGDGE